MERARLCETGPDPCESARMNVRPEGVFISRRHLSVKTFENMPAALLRSKTPFKVVSFQPIGYCWRAVSTLLASLSCYTPVEVYYMCEYCRCVTCLLPLSSGTFKFPFLLLLGCNGNKYSFVCGSAEPYIVALKAY